MEGQVITFPEEYHNILGSARFMEHQDPIKAKKLYLEAARFLLQLCSEENSASKDYEAEARRLLNKYEDLNRTHGRLIALGGYKVMSLSSPQVKVIGVLESTVGNNYSKTSLKQVCGLKQLKQEIFLKIILPLKRPEIIAKYKQKMKPGILMYGPPGCGKSLVAEALANDVGIPFFHIKASDLKSKWVGETEKNIAALFDDAKRNAPSIIFIDEFESIGRSRGHEGFSHEKNIVSQLLTEMDGVGNKKDRVIVIGATNEPWEIDPALLRSGRLGRKIFVPAPDLITREEILAMELSERPIDSTVDCGELAEISEGYSAADLVLWCDAASELALLRELKEGKSQIIKQDLLLAQHKIKPVTRSWFLNANRQIRMRGLAEDFPEINTMQAKQHEYV